MRCFQNNNKNYIHFSDLKKNLKNHHCLKEKYIYDPFTVVGPFLTMDAMVPTNVGSCLRHNAFQDCPAGHTHGELSLLHSLPPNPLKVQFKWVWYFLTFLSESFLLFLYNPVFK